MRPSARGWVTLAVLAMVAALPAIASAANSTYTPRQLAAARQEVQAARRAGPAALRALDRRAMRRSAQVADTTTPTVGPPPAQQALAAALFQEGTSTVGESASPPVGPPPPPTGTAPSVFTPSFRAHAANTCWGKQSSWWNHSIAGGAIVAKMQKWNYGWCGNGSALTSGAYNFDHWSWAQYPYCLTNMSNRQGPDGTSGNWAHGGIWGTTGVYTIAVVCAPILGGEHAVLRIAGNGYFDLYDDYGF